MPLIYTVLWLPSWYKGRIELLQQRHPHPQSLKYLLSGPLQEKFVDICLSIPQTSSKSEPFADHSVDLALPSVQGTSWFHDFVFSPGPSCCALCITVLPLVNEKGNEERGGGNCFLLFKTNVKKPCEYFWHFKKKNVGGSLFAWNFMWFRKPICNPFEFKSHLSLLLEW